MKLTIPSTFSASVAMLLLSVALAGCDAPAPSGPASEAEPAEAGSAGIEALEDVLREPESVARAGRLAALLPKLDPEALPRVERALKRDPRLRAADFDLLLRFWARHDPEYAVTWAIVESPTQYRSAAIRSAVEEWARNDPAAAVAGVSGVAQSDIRDIAQSVQLGLVWGWFHTDRPGLEKYIPGLGSGVQRQRAIFAFALELGRVEDSDAVMRWAESVPEDDQRYKLAVYRQVATALGWTDGPAAERWCAAQCAGPFGARMLSALSRTRIMRGEDGGAVVTWVATAPRSEDEDLAVLLTGAYGVWATEDRKAAVAWMERRIAGDPEPWVSLLYGAYAMQLAATSPAEAIVWAEREVAEAGREELMVRVARRWLKKDPEAAEAWLQQSPLSEPARARARNLALPDYLPHPAPEPELAPEPEPESEPEATP